jgi:hypothetical protein
MRSAGRDWSGSAADTARHALSTPLAATMRHERRERWAEEALLTATQEAHVRGVSTRKVDDLVKALGLDGISKPEVSRKPTLRNEVIKHPRAVGRRRQFPPAVADSQVACRESGARYPLRSGPFR